MLGRQPWFREIGCCLVWFLLVSYGRGEEERRTKCALLLLLVSFFSPAGVAGLCCVAGGKGGFGRDANSSGGTGAAAVQAGRCRNVSRRIERRRDCAAGGSKVLPL